MALHSAHRDTYFVGPVGQVVQWVVQTDHLFMCSDKYGEVRFLY